jgi:ribose transport system ATP-binding protein
VTEATQLNGELLQAQGLSKSYGHVRALTDVSLTVGPGETVAVLGHNGSGKSTLMKVLSGRVRSDAGTATICGEALGGADASARARVLGVRVVDQEFPLCLTLTVRENLVVKHPSIRSRRLLKRATKVFAETLEEIFPASGIKLQAEAQELSVAQRQMLEVALAACVALPQERLDLLLLDEATSALPEARRDQLFSYVRSLRKTGIGVVLISHRLEEVIDHADRVEVLRDGQHVGSLSGPEISSRAMIDLMGGAAARTAPARGAAAGAGGASGAASQDVQPLCVIDDFSGRGLRNVSATVRPAEIVGVAGLEGQGQRDLLTLLFEAGKGRRRRGVTMSTTIAYVSGDRNAEGIFPLWSVAQNISIGAMRATSKLGFIQRGPESELAQTWIDRLQIRTAASDSLITDLSGGSQQKTLIARVLASNAHLILLDDPTRGVDVGTKADIYELLRAAVAEGRSFVWYSTDNAEFEQCDRVLVMREGSVVRELDVDEVSVTELVSASFAAEPEAPIGSEANDPPTAPGAQ